MAQGAAMGKAFFQVDDIEVEAGFVGVDAIAAVDRVAAIRKEACDKAIAEDVVARSQRNIIRSGTSNDPVGSGTSDEAVVAFSEVDGADDRSGGIIDFVIAATQFDVAEDRSGIGDEVGCLASGYGLVASADDAEIVEDEDSPLDDEIPISWPRMVPKLKIRSKPLSSGEVN